MINWRRKLASARERIESQGLGGMARHLVRRAFNSLRPGDTGWLVRKRIVDQSFDSEYDVDTTGVTELAELQISGKNKLQGLPHIASDPEEFSGALASLHISHEDFVFVDLGSGKGRALFLALAMPFRRIVGVEFALELYQIAEANLRRLAAAGKDIGRISLVHADVTQFELPAEPLVIYLYNPFSEKVMKAVVERVLESYKMHTRRIYIIYANAFFAKLWLEGGFAELQRGGTYVLLAPIGADTSAGR